MRWMLPLLGAALLACSGCGNAGHARLSPAPYDVQAHNRIAHLADPSASRSWNRTIAHSGERAAATVERYRTGSEQPAASQ